MSGGAIDRDASSKCGPIAFSLSWRRKSTTPVRTAGMTSVARTRSVAWVASDGRAESQPDSSRLNIAIGTRLRLRLSRIFQRESAER